MEFLATLDELDAKGLESKKDCRDYNKDETQKTVMHIMTMKRLLG